MTNRDDEHNQGVPPPLPPGYENLSNENQESQQGGPPPLPKGSSGSSTRPPVPSAGNPPSGKLQKPASPYQGMPPQQPPPQAYTQSPPEPPQQTGLQLTGHHQQGLHPNAPQYNTTWQTNQQTVRVGTSNSAIIGLVLSILGLVFCGLLAPIGLIVSYGAAKENRDGVAVAGIVIGWIGTIFVGLVIIGFAMIFVVPLLLAVVLGAAGV